MLFQYYYQWFVLVGVVINDALAILPITIIILVISVVILGVAIEDASAQSDHAIV